MMAPDEVVFLLDVDNTLLDNDHIVADLDEHLRREFGHKSRDRYWATFEVLRDELGYADYLGALQRYRLGDSADGDVVFQPRKIQQSGLWDAVEGRVLIYLHKEQMLEEVERRYPAHHYVMVDDKLRILTAMKEIWGDRLTTVFPRQGHYAIDSRNTAAYPPADITVEHIGELNNYDLSTLLGAPETGRAAQETP